MLKFVRNLAVGLLLCVAPAAQMFAQLHPLPGSKSEAAVICTGCLNTNASGQANDGLPTYPYSPPLIDHVGRYVDSTKTASFQHIGFRTARARQIRTVHERRGTAPPRMYIQIGDAIGAYTLDKFFSTTLPAGMGSIQGVKTGSSVGGFGRTPPEKVAMFEGFLYPEASAAEWRVPFQDGQDRLGGGGAIDVDDRGYLYGAYTVFGWGIVKDDGRVDAGHFPKVSQMIAGGSTIAKTFDDKSGVSPESIVVWKSGSKYYAAVADLGEGQGLWDVTDPAAPKLLAIRKDSTKRYGIRKWDRDDANQRIAYIGGDKKLYIHDYASFAAGTAPTPVLEETSATFTDLSFDESGNLWVAEASDRIWKFTRTGNAYTPVKYSPHTGRFDQKVMHVADGYIFVAGTDFSGGLAYDARLLKIESSGPRNIDLDGFFKRYYHAAPANYAQPAGYTGIQADVQIVKSNGKTYLMYSTFGLGDVYEIEGGDSISIKVKNNAFGTANPNSKGQPGPYVGDTVTFTAPSSNAQVTYDVTWDFGNPEVGTSENQGRKRSTEEISHQYTALATASAITQPRTVKAVTIQDTAIASQYVLNLKVPTPRIGVSGVTTPITAAPSNLQLVAGQTFNDASDGSVEGHYSIWTIDGVVTKLAPNATIPVGAVGVHTMSFQGAYGKYDASFNGTSPYMTTPIAFTYTVRPFNVKLDAPTSNGTNVTFKATPNVTPDSTIVTATTWNVTWTLTPPSGAPVTQTQAATIGHIPNFAVLNSQVTTGTTVKVEVSVDPTGLSQAAQPYAIASDTITLTTPDPQITITGCGNAGSPCKFEASSISSASMADWTFAWTLKLTNGTVVRNGSGSALDAPIASAGNYVISLKATKSIFETTVEKPLTVGASLCSPLPPAHQVTINKQGCASSCAAGTTVTFSPSFQGYSAQGCDSFSWSFGPGEGSATGLQVQHTYNTPGSFNVTLTISNPNGNLVENTTVTVSGGNTGNPNTCSAPPSAAMTISGCSTGGCRTTDNITFSARRGSGNLQNCDSVAWTFSDNTTSTSRTPVKSFSTPGTYTATLVVSNNLGSATTTESVTVTAPPVGNCSTPPGPGNFAITYSAPSGCSNINGQDCKASENISFVAEDFYYTPAPCDNYEWDFGDNSAKVNTRNASHAYSNAGTFPVKLRVYNQSGSWTYSKNVKIEGTVAVKPVPQLTATIPANGVKGRTVTFTATSNLPNTTGWTWNFGDGTANNTTQAGETRQTSTITYTYTKTGKFTVTATARNSEDAVTAPVGTVQGSITVADAPAIPEYRYLLPIAAHTNGLGGSAWRTDVQIYNPDPNASTTNPLRMTASFKGSNYDLEVPTSTGILEDFLGTLVNRDDQGPVILTTKNVMAPPQIWTRTYTQTAHGTFGQFIPAIRIDSNAGGAGVALDGKYYLAGLRHNDRYRTNVGFLNPNSEPVTATITVYDDRHLGIKQFTRTLQPFQLDTINPLKAIVENLPADRPFSLEIDVPAGKWLIAYASYIDSKSNDPVYLQAVRESEVAGADYRTTVIPGVGHTGAWRSDVTIFNPDSAAVQFDLQYFDNNGTKLAEALGVVLDPFKFLQYDDILKQGIFGNALDGLGTLKIVATTPVPNSKYPMSFARTYNDDGANGTFGQGIGAFSAARANVQPNKPALLAGVRNSSNYRTNIGLVNLSNAPVTVTVTLLDPVTGAAAISVPYTLNVNQSLVGPFSQNNWNGISTATFKIQATGNVWAFASIIDLQTADPQYVPATPLQQQ